MGVTDLGSSSEISQRPVLAAYLPRMFGRGKEGATDEAWQWLSEVGSGLVELIDGFRRLGGIG